MCRQFSTTKGLGGGSLVMHMFLGVNISKKYNCFQDHIYLINVMCRYSQLKKQLKYEIIAGSHVVSGHFVLKILQIVNFLILVVRDFKTTSNIENTTLI